MEAVAVVNFVERVVLLGAVLLAWAIELRFPMQPGYRLRWHTMLFVLTGLALIGVIAGSGFLIPDDLIPAARFLNFVIGTPTVLALLALLTFMWRYRKT